MIRFRSLAFIPAVLLWISTGFTQGVVENSAGTSTYKAGNTKLIEFFDVHNAEIRSVFRQLSSYSGYDIVVGDEVKGTVSLSVSNKSWEEILGIVCRISNLAAVNEDGYIYIITAEEFSKRKVGSAAELEFKQISSPLHREVIRLRYVTAKELSPTIQQMLTARGKMSVAEHTNALIILDTDENIEQIRRLVMDLDIASPQVSISCKIIEVSSGVVQKMGVNWNITDPRYNATVSHLDPTSVISDKAINKVTYGVLTPERFGATLEYLFEDNKGDVIAQPQITTLDNKEAKVFMGQKIPIKSKDIAGNTLVQLVNAGTELVVHPHISSDGKILLKLNPRKESYQLLSDGSPIISEQSASTTVMINNGETVVIAGLTSDETKNTEAGIPLLKSIPIIGALFKRSSKNLEKRDLVIFVTPHIIPSEM